MTPTFLLDLTDSPFQASYGEVSWSKPLQANTPGNAMLPWNAVFLAFAASPNAAHYRA
jgi:hypothetical protein